MVQWPLHPIADVAVYALRPIEPVVSVFWLTHSSFETCEQGQDDTLGRQQSYVGCRTFCSQSKILLFTSQRMILKCYKGIEVLTFCLLRLYDSASSPHFT